MNSRNVKVAGIVIGILLVGGVGYWAYNKYLKTTVDNARLFGIY